MSTRHANKAPYENRERTAELQGAPAHTHRAAEQSRTQAPAGSHGVAAFGHDDISALAYELWQARGCPDGSPQEDWFNASEQLRSRSYTR